jgi:hypothetical protein
MVKWKLMLTTLPYVAAVLAAKLVLSLVFNFKGVVEFSEVALVLTGGIFLVGFMLAGTMADFKESERLPAEIACTLESIEETFALAAESKSLDLAALRRGVAALTQAITDWLYRKRTHAELFVALEAFGGYARQLEKGGASSQAARVLGETHNLRKMLTRVGVISRTGFLASGYALLETLVCAIIALLLISSFRSALAQSILVSFVSLVYIYMLRLIRDIDDPFEYTESGAKGAAEVELFPLGEYAERLSGRLSP